MNAELFLLGRRIDMGARARRRWLVVLIYATMAALVYFSDDIVRRRR